MNICVVGLGRQSINRHEFWKEDMEKIAIKIALIIFLLANVSGCVTQETEEHTTPTELSRTSTVTPIGQQQNPTRDILPTMTYFPALSCLGSA